MRKQYHFWTGEQGLDAWDVDPAYPVILGPDQRVMDGMHRIARAVLEGWTSIAAVRFLRLPEPDYRDCRPEDLPYDRA